MFVIQILVPVLPIHGRSLCLGLLLQSQKAGLSEAQRHDFLWFGNEGLRDKSPKLPNMELTERRDTMIPFFGGGCETWRCCGQRLLLCKSHQILSCSTKMLFPKSQPARGCPCLYLTALAFPMFIISNRSHDLHLHLHLLPGDPELWWDPVGLL